jgi:hypothetical protein
MTRAQHVCKVDKRYAGCLTKFIKRKQGIYRAICGEKQMYFTEEMLRSEK